MPITVTRDLSGKMRQVIQIRDHRVIADASVEQGGEDSGAGPHDLYDAALGACKAVTVLWYANRRNIPVRDIQVVVERDNSQEREGTYRLATTLSLGGDLSDAQRQELLAVASKCPIHKLMTEATTEITTTLAGA